MRAFVITAGLLLALLAEASSAPAQTPPRNVVLIVSDDQSYESVAKMPYLGTRIPPKGGWYRFDNALINNATCCPSRATILTGLWSHHHGVEATAGAPAFDDTSTVATWLDTAGYRTGFIGKYHLGTEVSNPPTTYIPPGWDEWMAWHGINGREAYYDYTLNENGTLVPYGTEPADYSTDVLAGKATDFISRNAGGAPFFLLFAPRAPHGPWTPAPRDIGTYAGEPVPHSPSYNEDTSDKPAWWAALPLKKPSNTDPARRKLWETTLALDDAVKGIITALQNAQAMRNTVIIYMTDNGYALGEHRYTKKVCAYEECSRTPLLVKYLGRNDGLVIPQVVSNEDLAPTLASLAGISPPAPVDGTSFAPLLEGQQPPSWPEEALLRAYNPNNPGRPPTFWGIRTRDYKYIETVGTGEVELYDLAADPYELENVAGEPAYAAIQAALAARLAVLRQ
jgi:N-acetylglucosamine-6-sulfatase